jgi:arsenate reductase (thioredoxin)
MKTKPKVLFVCVENSCRSQMAEGLARSLNGAFVEAYSAGSRPSGVVSPDAVKVMAEIGIDISGQRSKGFEGLPGKEFDYVVTLGCQDQCPFVPAEQHIDWNIADPKGKGTEAFRRARDIIRAKIQELISRVISGKKLEG